MVSSRFHGGHIRCVAPLPTRELSSWIACCAISRAGWSARPLPSLSQGGTVANFARRNCYAYSMKCARCDHRFANPYDDDLPPVIAVSLPTVTTGGV